jgi:hypothetical protein
MPMWNAAHHTSGGAVWPVADRKPERGHALMMLQERLDDACAPVAWWPSLGSAMA